MVDDVTQKVGLATDFSLGDYLNAVASKNRTIIAKGIHRRFKERYLNPVSTGKNRHGFTMMAVACLMIEALESFRNGWPDTKSQGMGQKAFKSFFNAHQAFAPFRLHTIEFYRGVRCGILHQAETTLGWRIRRNGDLLEIDGAIRTINATKFTKATEVALDSYCNQLKTAEWDDEIWCLLRKKMEQVCTNCAPKSSF